MKEIAKTDRYLLCVDKVKNRVYLTSRGIWTRKADFSDFTEAVDRALAEVSRGFSAVLDIRRMKMPSAEMAEYFIEVLEKVLAAGLSKQAEVIPKSIHTEYELRSAAEITGLTRKGFLNKDEAEAWLDSEAWEENGVCC